MPKKKREIKQWKDLTISDAYMFARVFENPTLCKKFLEMVLERPIKKIETITTEDDIDLQYEKKAVRLGNL